DHSVLLLGNECRQLRQQFSRRTRQSEALAATLQARQVPVQQGRSAPTHGDAFKQTVAIGQPTILQGKLLARLAIDPATHQSRNRRNSSEPLVPPKPNELDSTASIDMCRA